jgi:hypothetical protein
MRRRPYAQPLSSVGTDENLSTTARSRLQEPPLVGAQGQVLIALARGEPRHRSIRHKTVEFAPNSGEFTVTTQLVHAHKGVLPRSGSTKRSDGGQDEPVGLGIAAGPRLPSSKGEGNWGRGRGNGRLPGAKVEMVVRAVPRPGRTRSGRKEWTWTARRARRSQPQAESSFGGEIVRARRPRQDSDRELNSQALAAIAEAARRSREARVGPEPGTTRPVDTRATRAAHPPAHQPVEGSILRTPDLPSGPQGAMASMHTPEAPAAPATPSDLPTRQGRATEPLAASPPHSAAVAEPVPETEPVRHHQGRVPFGVGTTPPPYADTGSRGTEGSVGPFGTAEAPFSLEPRVPGGGPLRRAPTNAGERRLRWAIGITAVLLVAVLAAMVGTRSSGGNQASGPASSTSGGSGVPFTKPSTGSTGESSGLGPTSPTSTPPTSTPTPTTAAEPGGSPALSTLDPSTGYVGQSVTVTGSNFLSPSGQISADVNGQPAPVTCLDQVTCTLVIPAVGGSAPSAPVTITTDSGTSNALFFTYVEADDPGSSGSQEPHPHHAARRSTGMNHVTRPFRRTHQPG